MGTKGAVYSIARLAELLALQINNNELWLAEIRDIYKESLRLPQGPDLSDPQRRWTVKLSQLLGRVWAEQVRPYYTDDPGFPLSRPCIPAVLIFQLTYVEEE